MNAHAKVRDRPFRLPARLPVDLRARRRVAGRRPHRPRARRQGQQLHGRRHLRQGRALCRAHPSSRPADASAAPHGPEGLGPVRAHLLGRRARPHGRGHAGGRAHATAPEAVWPYYYAGTMGLVMRDGINRLRHAKRYSGMYATICTTTGVDRLHRRHRQAGRPRSARDGEVRPGGDLGHQPGQHPGQRDDARGRAPARSAAPRSSPSTSTSNGTMQQADLALCLRPGTDGALACAVMHVLFRDGHANWPYLEQYTDCPRELEAHLRDKTPEWASAITGLTVAEIETFAQDGRHHAARPTSGSATASRASATAPTTCMRRCASRR